jgi:hypothetical protein
MAESEAGPRRLTPEEMISLALAVGVELDNERASVLVDQAEPHFGLLRALDTIDLTGAEPAGEFRLDHAKGVAGG